MSTSRSHDRNPDSAVLATSHHVTPTAAPSAPRTTHLIDWLTYTVPWNSDLSAALFPHDALFITGEPLENIKGYNTSLGLSHGRISYHTEHPENKTCVQLGGADLWHLRQAGIDLRELLAYVYQTLNATITRLDYAVDWYGEGDPWDLYYSWKANQLHTLAKRAYVKMEAYKVDGVTREIPTIYLGSGKSNRMLRCYDKAAQLGVPGPRIRIELVLRDKLANLVVKAMIQDGIGPTGNQAIRHHVQGDIAWFNQAISGPSIYIETPPPKERDPKRWLLSNVLPTFERTLESDAAVGDFEVFDAYWPIMRKTAAKRHGALLP